MEEITNKTEALKAVSYNGDGSNLQYCSLELRDDEEVVREALNYPISSFQFASRRLRSSKEFILQVLSERWADQEMILEYVVPSLKSDRDFFLKLLNIRGSCAGKYAHASIKFDKDFIIECARADASLGYYYAFDWIREAPLEILNDRDLFHQLKTFSVGEFWIYASEELKSDVSFLREYGQENVFQHASKTVLHNVAFVVERLTSFPAEFIALPEKLRASEQYASLALNAAISSDWLPYPDCISEIYKSLAPDLKNEPRLFLQAVNSVKLEDAGVEIRKNEACITAVFERGITKKEVGLIDESLLEDETFITKVFHQFPEGSAEYFPDKMQSNPLFMFDYCKAQLEKFPDSYPWAEVKNEHEEVLLANFSFVRKMILELGAIRIYDYDRELSSEQICKNLANRELVMHGLSICNTWQTYKDEVGDWLYETEYGHLEDFVDGDDEEMMLKAIDLDKSAIGQVSNRLKADEDFILKTFDAKRTYQTVFCDYYFRSYIKGHESSSRIMLKAFSETFRFHAKETLESAWYRSDGEKPIMVDPFNALNYASKELLNDRNFIFSCLNIVTDYAENSEEESYASAMRWCHKVFRCISGQLKSDKSLLLDVIDFYSGVVFNKALDETVFSKPDVLKRLLTAAKNESDSGLFEFDSSSEFKTHFEWFLDNFWQRWGGTSIGELIDSDSELRKLAGWDE